MPPDLHPSIEQRVSIIEERTLRMCDLLNFLAHVVATQTGVDGERRWITRDVRTLWDEYHQDQT